MRNFKGFNFVYSNQIFIKDLALSERSRAGWSADRGLRGMSALSAGGPLSADFAHFRGNSRKSRNSRAKRRIPVLSAGGPRAQIPRLSAFFAGSNGTGISFCFGKSGRPRVGFTGSQGTITTLPSQPGVFSPIGAVYPGPNGLQ